MVKGFIVASIKWLNSRELNNITEFKRLNFRMKLDNLTKE